MNWRLAPVIFAMVSVVVIGSIMVVALVMGHEDSQAMIASAGFGLLLSLPATYIITSKLVQFTLRQKQQGS